MKRLVSILTAFIVVAGFAAIQVTQAKGAEQGLDVKKIVVATSVQDREPVGENTEFPASVGTLSCWTKVAAKTLPSTVKHVWYIGDKKVFELSLDIKYPSTNTWSTVSVRPGTWKVVVTDAAGAELSSVSFSVK